MRSRWLAVGVVGAALACADPSDVLFTRQVVPPLEVSPGLFRVTFDPQPDLVRGFTATGDSILFRASRGGILGTGDSAWQMLAMDVHGSLGASEEAFIYRAVFDRPIGTIFARPNDRLVSLWQRGNDGAFVGPAGCPTLPYIRLWRVVLFQLPARDGAALSTLPEWKVRMPTVDTVQFVPGRLLELRMRFTLAELAAEGGSNPLGPVAAPDSGTAIYSDGDTLWRIDLGRPAAPRVSIGAAMFPAVSPDGSMLAFTAGAGVDSLFRQQQICFLLFCCLQDMWTMTSTGFTTYVVDVARGDTVLSVSGSEPVFDTARRRLLVRRPTGLTWIDVDTKAEAGVPNTDGAFSAAVSPDGAYLAFSKTVSNNTDVYFVKLN